MESARDRAHRVRIALDVHAGKENRGAAEQWRLRLRACRAIQLHVGSTPALRRRRAVPALRYHHPVGSRRLRDPSTANRPGEPWQ